MGGPEDSDVEMNEAWNRISRIRRSFQYPSPSSSTPRSSRPSDFPSRASVDVNKIRQELESICGSHKVPKSPASDDSAFVALDSILKGAAIESKYVLIFIQFILKNFFQSPIQKRSKL